MHVKLPMCFTWHFKGPILANPLTLYVPHVADSCLEDEETTQGEHSVVLWNSHGLMATASTRPASKAASGNGLCIGMAWIAVFNSSKIFKDQHLLWFVITTTAITINYHQLSSTLPFNCAIQLFHFRNFTARCLPWFRLVIRWLQSWRPQSMTVGPFWPLTHAVPPKVSRLGIAGHRWGISLRMEFLSGRLLALLTVKEWEPHVPKWMLLTTCLLVLLGDIWNIKWKL